MYRIAILIPAGAGDKEKQMYMLSRAEEAVLLAVLRLEGEAYGLSIRRFIREAMGVQWSLAQIYNPLDRLAQKGYVRKYLGPPSPERGGRHKVLYRITPEGKDALAELRRIQVRLWQNAARSGGSSSVNPFWRRRSPWRPPPFSSSSLFRPSDP